MKTPLLPDRRMRNLGFTDHSVENWYFTQRVGKDISFNLTINKDTGEYKTVVLHESFLQPEPYYEMSEPHRTAVIANIDVIVYDFNRAGLAIEHDHTEYAY